MLNLSYNNVSKYGFTEVVNAYKTIPRILTVYISFNQLHFNNKTPVIKMTSLYLNDDNINCEFPKVNSCDDTAIDLFDRSEEYRAEVLGCCLVDNRDIKALDLSFDGLTCVGISKIIDTLNLNSMLDYLDISYYNLSDDGIITISGSLRNNKTLQKLIILWNNNRIALSGSVQSYDVSKMGYGDAGAILVSAFLRNSTMITELYLSQCDISDLGAMAIGGYLRNSGTLKYLDISNNNITSVGVIEIGKAIEVNTVLQTLDFSHNDIPYNGILEFSKYLKKNESLQTLKIFCGNNHITLEAAGQLCHICSKGFTNTEAILILAFFCNLTQLRVQEISQIISPDGIYDHENYNKGRSLNSFKISWNNNYAFLDATVQSYNVCNQNMSRTGEIYIAEFLQNNTYLHKFNFLNNVCDNGSKPFGDFYKSDSAFQHFSLSENAVHGIKSVTTTNLQILDISNNNISDDGAIAISEYLKHNNTLQDLKMSHNSVTDVGAARISEVITSSIILQTLNISHNNISDDGAIAISEYLKTNNTLQSLNLAENNITSVGAKRISEVIKSNMILQTLDISYNTISDDGAITIIIAVTNHKTPLSIDVSENSRKLDEVNMLNSSLQKLNISHNNISDVGVTEIIKCLKMNTTLQELTISWRRSYSIYYPYQHDDHFLNLNNSSHSYNMYGKHFGDTGIILILAFLQNNHNTIQELYVVNNNISDDGAIAISEYLKTNNTLQSLNLAENNITSVGAKRISEVIKSSMILQTLDISQNNISDDGAITIIKAVTNKTSLSVDVSENSRKLDEVNMLNSSLQKLNISHNNISDVGVTEISKCLKMNTTLQELTISWRRSLQTYSWFCQYQHDDPFLNLNNSSHSYNMCGKYFDDTGIILILALLQNNHNTIQELHVANNNISDDGAIAISEYLKTNNTLQSLNLAKNNITSVGAKRISEVIKSSMILQTLDISHNKISDDGATVISEYLKTNNTLQSLNLAKNNITSVGAKRISEVIKSSIILQTLDISHNNISDDGAITIIKAVTNNKTSLSIDVSENSRKLDEVNMLNSSLQKLNISHNNISDVGVTEISKCLKMNTTLQELTISWRRSLQKYSLSYQYRHDDPFLNLNNSSHSYNMYGKHFGDTGIILILAFLQNNHNTIQELHVANNNISDDGAIAISEYLKTNNTLQSLNLAENNITSVGAKRISEVIKSSMILQTLDISYNNISDDGAITIIKAVTNKTSLSINVSENSRKLDEVNMLNSSLQKLNISHNNISDVGVTEISKCLKMNTTLQELTISWRRSLQTYSWFCQYQHDDHFLNLNNSSHSYNMCGDCFDDTGIILILAFLQNNHNTIQELHVAYNNISDDGAIAISEYLKTNNTLQSLNLAGNNITSVGAKRISEAIKINTVLQTLDISRNRISDDGVVAISSCIKENYTLRHFISDDDISSNVMEKVREDIGSQLIAIPRCIVFAPNSGFLQTMPLSCTHNRSKIGMHMNIELDSSNAWAPMQFIDPIFSGNNTLNFANAKTHVKSVQFTNGRKCFKSKHSKRFGNPKHPYKSHTKH